MAIRATLNVPKNTSRVRLRLFTPTVPLYSNSNLPLSTHHLLKHTPQFVNVRRLMTRWVVLTNPAKAQTVSSRETNETGGDDAPARDLDMVEAMTVAHRELITITRSYRIDNVMLRRRVRQLTRDFEEMRLKVDKRAEEWRALALEACYQKRAWIQETDALRARLRAVSSLTRMERDEIVRM
jgi:hypothetical protein